MSKSRFNDGKSETKKSCDVDMAIIKNITGKMIKSSSIIQDLMDESIFFTNMAWIWFIISGVPVSKVVAVFTFTKTEVLFHCCKV